MAIDLEKDFHSFHKDVVNQFWTAFHQLEMRVRDSKESLLQDLSSHLSLRDQEFESSKLRLLGGQQDLSQNLTRIEQSFCRALQSGETTVAARIQDQLSEHQASTRMLFENVSARQDAMSSHLKNLVRSTCNL